MSQNGSDCDCLDPTGWMPPLGREGAASVQRSAFVSTAIILAVLVIAALAEAAYALRIVDRERRLSTDFSPTALMRTIAHIAETPNSAVFLGDSVLWGYGLDADATAVSVIAARRPAFNLGFKSGSAPNDYVMVRLLAASGARPRAAVIEINQKTFNSADADYQHLHPALAALAYPLLNEGDRALLAAAPPAQTLQARADRALTGLWPVYAMRSDLREAIYGTAPIAPPPTGTDAYEGTYDLTPLTQANVGVRFLTETVDVLRADHIPTIAFLTPTNHRLLHDYIDNPQYARNGAYLAQLLRAHGVHVLDLDRLLPARDFIDEVHLTADGQRRLAAVLTAALPH